MWAFSQEDLPFSLRFSPSPSGPHMHSHWSVTGFTLTGSTALVLEQTVFTQMLQEELGFLPLETSSWTKFKLLTSLKFWLCLIWIFPSRWEYPSASSASNSSPPWKLLLFLFSLCGFSNPGSVCHQTKAKAWPPVLLHLKPPPLLDFQSVFLSLGHCRWKASPPGARICPAAVFLCYPRQMWTSST